MKKRFMKEDVIMRRLKFVIAPLVVLLLVMILPILTRAMGSVTNVMLASREFPQLDGNLVAFTVFEFEQGNTDLNGDGDTDDSVLHVFDASAQNGDIVNDLVMFNPIKSTFNTTSDTTGCPSGFVGKFSFDARLTNISGSQLSDLIVEVTELTNGNLLQNADGGPGGVEARLSVPRVGGFSDGVLEPNESVDVPFIICLKNKDPFSFFVDVLGICGVNILVKQR